MFCALRLRGFNNCSGYFTGALLIFIVSFLFLPTSKMVNNVYYVLLAVPALGVLLISGGQKIKFSLALLLWAGLYFWFLVVGILSADGQWLKYTVYAALFTLLVSQFVDPRPFRTPWFARGLFWVLSVYVLGSTIFYWFVGRYVPGERVLWLPARMSGPIYTSMWLACCFTLALPVWIERRCWFELSAALLLVVFCVAYVLQSRSGLLGMVALGGLVAVGLVLRRARYILLVGLVGFVTGLLVFLAVREVAEIARLFGRADSGRFELWSIFLGEWMKCGFLLGCGVSADIEVVISKGVFIQHPHNIFLALGFYSGLVSLLIFLFLMVVILRQAWRRRDPWGGYLLLALIMLNFDGNKFVDNPNELWLLVLLPSALIINSRDGPLLN